MMQRRIKNKVRRIIRESMEEILSQEYRTKKVKPEELEDETYAWSGELDPKISDLKKDNDTFDDRSAGGEYKINQANPTFYVNGEEMDADSISNFHNDFAIVKCNGQEGFINKDGELVGGIFFNRCDDFEDGWGLVVNSDGKRNYINGEGEFLLDNWVGRASSFMNGEAMVINNGQRYKIDTQGNIIE